jgi:hypothetical protein
MAKKSIFFHFLLGNPKPNHDKLIGNEKINKNRYFSLFIRGIKISCSGIGSLIKDPKNP